MEDAIAQESMEGTDVVFSVGPRWLLELVQRYFTFGDCLLPAVFDLHGSPVLQHYAALDLRCHSAMSYEEYWGPEIVMALQLGMLGEYKSAAEHPRQACAAAPQYVRQKDVTPSQKTLRELASSVASLQNFGPE